MASRAWVTGGSRGIGRAIALQLAKDGFDVTITYRSNQELAEKVVEELQGCGVNARAVCFDLGDVDDAESAVEKMLDDDGTPMVLVNNAGMTQDGLFPRMKREAWSRVMDVNLGGFYTMTQPVAKRMLKERAGRIINITSVSGQRATRPGQLRGEQRIIGATKALAFELAKRVTGQCSVPGFIETDMLMG